MYTFRLPEKHSVIYIFKNLFPFLVGMNENCFPFCLILDVSGNFSPISLEARHRQCCRLVHSQKLTSMWQTFFGGLPPPSLALTLLMTAVRDTEQDTGTLVPTHKVPPPRSTCFLFLCCEFYRWRYGVVKIYINPLTYPPYIAWAKQKDVTGKNKNTFAVQKLFH